MELAARLRREAVATGERRLLVLAGEATRTRERAADALDAAGIDRAVTTYLGPGQPLDCASIDSRDSNELLGTTRTGLVVDCHERCEPNTLGRAVGTVAGGGLLVLLVPPLSAWPDRRDGFDETLAVPPFGLDEVTGLFRRRLVGTVRDHRGVAVVDVDSGAVVCDGLVDPAPALDSGSTSPDTAHETGTGLLEQAEAACLTGDQREVLGALERLRKPERALVVEADRGRGKSSVAGLAAAVLARDGLDVLVTAPSYQAASELFARAGELLAETAGSFNSEQPHRLDTENGTVRFCEAARAADLPGDPDRVFVDEAAALPVGLLGSLLAADGVAFMTTVHGYEGTGRGFSVRFRERLADSRHTVAEASLAEPVRYAAGDPVEVWSFRALALDARPPVAPVVAAATPETVSYRQLSPAELVADERLLGEVFGLLVLAHYRTEPNDLARLLDAPNVSVHALLADGHPVSVALLAREGGLSADTRASIYEGGTVRGNLIPDLLASQLRDEAAAEPVGHRVLRIATHDAARSRGLGSHLVEQLRAYASGDWLGVGFGATTRLLGFWRANGFGTVHLATSRDDRSGEHSAVVLDPLTPRGRALKQRHSRWFCRRLPGTLADHLSTLDPDIVRAVCRTIDRTPALELGAFDWRLAAGLPHGAAIHGTAPRAVRRLAVRHLVAPETGTTDKAERLLVRRALQCRPWPEAATEWPSQTACKRAFGETVRTLVEVYGTEQARDELKRFR